MNPKIMRAFHIAIIGAIALLAATVSYLARELASRPDEARVDRLIEERLARSMTEAPTEQKSTAPMEKQIDTLVDKRVGQRKSSAISDEEFNRRVETGIVVFLDKQRRAEEARPSQLAKSVPPPTRDDHVYGNSNAPVTLIEYSDFECPFCKSFHPTAKQLVDKSDGQVNWVYRHFPLDFHNPGAQKQAEASECAAELGGNDSFWKFADAIYQRTRSNGKGFPVNNLAPLAAEIGIDNGAFQKCLDSGKYARKVQKQTADGQRAGISGTPGNILLNTRTGQAIAVIGAQPYERLRDAAEKLLEAK